jgi:hypothetical protein
LGCGRAKLTAESEADSRKSSRVLGEAEMYSTFNHQIAQDRIADMHRQAQQDALARQARQDRQDRQPHKRPSAWHVLRLPVIVARRVLTA